MVLFVNFIHLAGGHEESSGSVLFRHLAGHFSRVGSNRLYPTQFAVRFNRRNERIPSFLNNRKVFVGWEVSLVDAVSQSVYDKSGGACFG